MTQDKPVLSAIHLVARDTPLWRPGRERDALVGFGSGASWVERAELNHMEQAVGTSPKGKRDAVNRKGQKGRSGGQNEPTSVPLASVCSVRTEEPAPPPPSPSGAADHWREGWPAADPTSHAAVSPAGPHSTVMTTRSGARAKKGMCY